MHSKQKDTAATSYQFAPSSIEGWNDCPVLPHSGSSSSLASGTKKGPARRTRRPVHVSHLGYHESLSQSSLTTATATPSPPVSRLPPNRSTGSLPLPPSPASSPSPRRRVEQQIEELVGEASTLSLEEHRTCVEKVTSRAILDSEANVVFLDRLFAAWKSGNRCVDNTAVVDILYEFTHADNGNVSWLLALKRLMAAVQQ